MQGHNSSKLHNWEKIIAVVEEFLDSSLYKSTFEVNLVSEMERAIFSDWKGRLRDICDYKQKINNKY